MSANVKSNSEYLPCVCCNKVKPTVYIPEAKGVMCVDCWRQNKAKWLRGADNNYFSMHQDYSGNNCTNNVYADWDSFILNCERSGRLEDFKSLWKLICSRYDISPLCYTKLVFEDETFCGASRRPATVGFARTHNIVYNGRPAMLSIMYLYLGDMLGHAFFVKIWFFRKGANSIDGKYWLYGNGKLNPFVLTRENSYSYEWAIYNSYGVGLSSYDYNLLRDKKHTDEEKLWFNREAEFSLRVPGNAKAGNALPQLSAEKRARAFKKILGV